MNQVRLRIENGQVVVDDGALPAQGTLEERVAVVRAATMGAERVSFVTDDVDQSAAFTIGRATAALPAELLPLVEVVVTPVGAASGGDDDHEADRRDDGIEQNHDAPSTIEQRHEAPSTIEQRHEPLSTSATEAAAAPAPTNARPSPTLSAAASFGQLIAELKKAASMHGPTHAVTIAAGKRLCSHPDARPGVRDFAASVVDAAGQEVRALDHLYHLARRFGAAAPEVQAALETFVGTSRDANWRRKKGQGAIGRGESSRVRAETVDSIVRSGPQPHSLHLLSPSSSWTIAIDETGDFEGPINKPGKVVGLAIPGGTALPPLQPGWHATDQRDVRVIDGVVQSVLDRRVGVFGLQLAAVPELSGDRWVRTTLEVLGWMLRLLPVTGPTEVEVLVEKRGEHDAGHDWSVPAAALLRHLVDEDPMRARQLKLRIRIIAKTASHLNGYVDAVAFTWGSPAAASRARLRQSGLVGRCLIDGDPAVLRSAFADLSGGRVPHDWPMLARRPDVDDPASLAGQLAERLRVKCRDDRTLWSALLAVTQRHLDSKAIHLTALGREVAFLSTCKPVDVVLPGGLQLAWDIARLEQRNHVGAVDEGAGRALDALGDRLFDELPALVCQADLVRAVEATNRFDFDGARRALRRWDATPVAVAGLQKHGRLESTRGQLAAFTGDLAGAAQHFDRALALFARLSDPAEARREIAHTATYRAIVAVDDAETDDDEVRRLVGAVVPLDRGIDALAADVDDGLKYVHHLLLRWLVARGTPADRGSYLAAAPRWSVGGGHPWPLIGVYRALLLLDANRRAEADFLDLAADSTVDGGPTVQFIGLTIRALATRLGLWPGRSDLDEAAIRAGLPLAPWSSLAALRAPRAANDGAARVLWARCLPFNFR